MYLKAMAAISEMDIRIEIKNVSKICAPFFVHG